jgi:hypothetical protein
VILHIVLYVFETWFSHWGKNINWGCFRVEYWGRYLGLRGWKKLKTGGNCRMSCMICAPHQILFGWDGQGLWHIQVEKYCIHGFDWETWGKENIEMT